MRKDAFESSKSIGFSTRAAGFSKNIIEPPKLNFSDVALTNPNLASEFYKRLIEMINDFEGDLDEEHEVGIRLVSFGQTLQFHIESIGYCNPSLITFQGRLQNGARVELIQHVSQINFLLMALPKMDESGPPRRIGFNLDENE
ncbi:DUF6173 family protein [Anoxybacteroides rupiense]|uniref:DUF6173 family protein n=1 Tax=Anoxybacteroides rupiense TaxID=311460 RepID=UPI002011CE57|nr:DUF6173 family protein [Anoxybacillus rupiensis]